MDADTPITGDAKNPDRGLGFPFASTSGTRDVRLLAMALREQWPMSAEKREIAVKRLEEVVSNPASKPRAFQIALKALISLSRVNLQCVDVAIRARAAEEFDERLKELEAWQAQQAMNPQADPGPRIEIVRSDREGRSRRAPGEEES